MSDTQSSGSVGFWYDTDKATGAKGGDSDIDSLVQSVAGNLKERRFAPDEVIFSEGEPGDAAYVIQSGVVQVLSTGPDGSGVILSVLKPGAMFGEMALISGNRRSATVKAFEETTCYVIEKAQFDRMMEGIDPWTRSLITLLVWKLRSISRLMALNTVQY